MNTCVEIYLCVREGKMETEDDYPTPEAIRLYGEYYRRLRETRLPAWHDFQGTSMPMVDTAMTTDVPSGEDDSAKCEGPPSESVSSPSSRHGLWAHMMYYFALAVSGCILLTVSIICLLVAVGVIQGERSGAWLQPLPSRVFPSRFILEAAGVEYHVLVDPLRHETVIRAISLQKGWLWSIFNGTMWEDCNGAIRDIVPLPTIDWTVPDLWLPGGTFRVVLQPVRVESRLGPVPFVDTSSPPILIERIPREVQLRVLDRSLVDLFRMVWKVPFSFNHAAVIEQYEVTAFDPASQSFMHISPDLGVHSYIVPIQFLNSSSNLLTTFVWPSDNPSWCNFTLDDRCGEMIPSCACLTERASHLAGSAVATQCGSCVQSTDPGCACWAKALQYFQLLLSQRCYTRVPVELPGAPTITYPCRAPYRCSWNFDSWSCSHEVELCENIQLYGMSQYC